MDKNNANKTSRFFKKEGIYVILFVCLCVIATVATVNTRNSKKIKVQPPVAEQESYTDAKKSKQSALSSEETKEKQTKVDNATQVKKDDAKTSIAVEKVPSTVSANTNATPSFNQLPVVGSLRQGHSEDPILVENNNSSNKQVWRDVKGIYLNCKIGQPVVAVEDGVVENAENDGVEGVTVIVKHNNGLKTVYSNLDKDLSVTKGKEVKKGETLGVIGKTATQYIAYSDLTNGFLHFQVLDGDNSVDPSNFGIKYEKSK